MPKIKDKKKDDFEKNRLKPEWSRFINAYLSGSNATDAYLAAYKDIKNRETAQAAGSRLLLNVIIQEEIGYRLDMERVSEGFIYSGLRDIAIKYRGSKTIMAAVRSLEILGKMRGLLVDTYKGEFTVGNPANVPSVLPKDRAEKIRAAVKGGGVIE